MKVRRSGRAERRLGNRVPIGGPEIAVLRPGSHLSQNGIAEEANRLDHLPLKRGGWAEADLLITVSHIFAIPREPGQDRYVATLDRACEAELLRNVLAKGDWGWAR